jgi:hypothetical protein
MAVTKSGGHLALTPEVMRKLTPADQLEFAPAYFQGQFMKLIPESSASLFTEADRIGIADAMTRTGAASTAEINELIAKTGDIYDLDDNLFRQRLGGILERNNVAGKEGIFAAIEAELSPYKNRILAPEKSDNIGGYINKLMVLGSTMEQQDDILKSLDEAGGVQASLANIIRAKTMTGLLAPSDAVDVAVQAGSLSIKGLDIVNSPAVRDAFIQGTAAALEAIQQTADVDQIAAALDGLIIGDLDSAGAHVLTQAGRRMGMQRAAKEALGLDMENLGLDSALFDLKLATNKEAQELILQGMQQGATDLLGESLFTDAQKDSIRATSERFQEQGVAGLRDEIVLAGNSKYRSASILINAAETSSAMIASSQRELFKSLNPTEIDAFYFRRQSDIMPRQLEEAGNELVSEFLNDAGKIDSMLREPGYQATQEAKSRESIFKIKMGEKYETLIKEETERLRTEGFTEIDELDVADAIERSQRSMKTGKNRMSTLLGSETEEGGYLADLFNRADVRRKYSMITSSSGFESSDTYRLSQVMDRALSMTTPTHRASLEDSFDETAKLQKFLIGLADRPSGPKGTLRGPAARGVGLDELVDGIMSPDEYRTITGLIKMGDQDPVGVIDDAVTRDMSAVSHTLGELRTLAEARKLGFEARYADTATGKVTIPKLINTLTGGAGAATTPVSGPGYKRITELFKDGTIKNLMDKPYIKPAAIGTAALAVFGFVYSANKDRSVEDMQGPPLLPGGSAYESAYPGNTLNMPPPQNLLPSGQNGVTYRVNASGSYADAQKFSEAAGGLTSDFSTSYYGGARDASANPYSEIVSSF